MSDDPTQAIDIPAEPVRRRGDRRVSDQLVMNDRRKGDRRRIPGMTALFRTLFRRGSDS
jgi:hypothetical protein